jgi:hypothetical protein
LENNRKVYKPYNPLIIKKNKTKNKKQKMTQYKIKKENKINQVLEIEGLKEYAKAIYIKNRDNLKHLDFNNIDSLISYLNINGYSIEVLK